MRYKLGDTVRVYKKPVFDASAEAAQKNLENVMRFLATGEIVDDNQPELMVLTTQKTIDINNKER